MNHMRCAARGGRLACLVLAALLGAGVAAAQTIPELQQVPIFFKLLTYDRTLNNESMEQLRIGLLVREDNDASRSNGEAFALALRNAEGKTINGLPYEFITIEWRDPGVLTERLRTEDISVLYVTQQQTEHLDAIKKLARELNILTLAANRDDVQGGLSIGIGLKNNRPKILVNLEALHQEGHDLEARVLRLCEVISSP